MPQKPSRCKDSESQRCPNFSIEAHAVSVKAPQINFYSQLCDRVCEGLLYVERFKKDEFSINEAIAASTLSLSRRELKPVYQKFKNNFKLSDADLKARGEAIERDFEIAMAGGDR